MRLLTDAVEGGGGGGWVGIGAIARMVHGDGGGLMLEKVGQLLPKGLYLHTEGRNLGCARGVLFGWGQKGGLAGGGFTRARWGRLRSRLGGV